MSLIMMVNGAAIPLGSALFGPLADVIPVWVIIVGGGAGVMVIAFAMALNPRLRSVSGPSQTGPDK